MHNMSDNTCVQWLRLHTCTVTFLILALLIPKTIGIMHGQAEIYTVLRFQSMCKADISERTDAVKSLSCACVL